MPITIKDQKIRVQVFNGGEDSTSEPAVVKPGFGSIVRNADISKLGKCTQTIGLTRIGDNPDKLVSQWTFDASSSIDDKSTNNGTDASITYVAGKFGMAASFNGTTSIITVPAAANINANGKTAFALVAWIYVNSDGEGDNGRIFDKMAGTANGYRLFVFGESGGTVKLDFEVGHSVTNTRIITSTTLTLGAWHKIVALYNTDKSGDIIIDGVLASYATDTTGSGTINNDSANALALGNRAALDRTFDGILDDLRFYNAVLTSDEYEMDKINGLGRFKVGTTINRLYRARDIHIERLDDDQKGWTVVSSAFTADQTTTMFQALDKFFYLNGVDNVQSMDTSEVFTDEGNTNTDPPRGSFGTLAQNNRAFISGVLTTGQRDYVWFSDPLAPQTFDRTINVFKVRSGGGGATTWLQTFKLNELIIYKEDSVYVLDMTGVTPLTDWTLQPVNSSVGTRAGRSVQDIGNDHIFLDNFGQVRLLSRTTFDKLTTGIISDPVQSVLNEINFSAIAKVRSWFIEGKYILAIPTGLNVENDTVLVWDSVAAGLIGNQDAGWSVYPSGRWTISEFAEFQFSDADITLAAADNRALTLCYKNAGLTDNGDAITMQVAGPDHDFGNRGTDKIWGPLYVVFDAGDNTTANIYAEIDRGGAQLLGTLSLSGGAPTLPIDLQFALGGSQKATAMFHVKQIGRGKTCRIMVEHEDYDTTCTFIEYELYAQERIMRDTS